MEIILTKLFGKTSRKQLKVGNPPEIFLILISIQVEEGTIGGQKPTVEILGEEKDSGKMIKKKLKR